ncbi:hypothetical protein GCM10025868_17140 [Angustibacter aerolatus]|uniref:Carbohydrate kinase FGGY N-terminal domain-containing protein n=1 Tax=Angustibacter aerolatus TaxID=1162965 RepID=A0ABQ6JH59_9ACTN|nr:hypothetical protein GCM10025868_17140 [Angustibacter aerolatus]
MALLSGGHVQDHETASQCDPMYDVREQRWSPWAAEVAGHLPLPPLVWPTEVVGEVHENASAATGLPVGTPVVAGTIDAWAEAASVGVRRPGDLMLMYGSTTFLLQVLDRHVVHPRLWATSGVDEGAHAGRRHGDVGQPHPVGAAGGGRGAVRAGSCARPVRRRRAPTACCCCRTSPANAPLCSTPWRAECWPG